MPQTNSFSATVNCIHYALLTNGYLTPNYTFRMLHIYLIGDEYINLIDMLTQNYIIYILLSLTLSKICLCLTSQKKCLHLPFQILYKLNVNSISWLDICMPTSSTHFLFRQRKEAQFCCVWWYPPQERYQDRTRAMQIATPVGWRIYTSRYFWMMS